MRAYYYPIVLLCMNMQFIQISNNASQPAEQWERAIRAGERLLQTIKLSTNKGEREERKVKGNSQEWKFHQQSRVRENWSTLESGIIIAVIIIACSTQHDVYMCIILLYTLAHIHTYTHMWISKLLCIRTYIFLDMCLDKRFAFPRKQYNLDNTKGYFFLVVFLCI